MRVRFVPQVEIGGSIVTCDPWGEDTFEVGDIPDAVLADAYQMDQYKWHPNSPLWIEQWGGPFEIVAVVHPSTPVQSE